MGYQKEETFLWGKWWVLFYIFESVVGHLTGKCPEGSLKSKIRASDWDCTQSCWERFIYSLFLCFIHSFILSLHPKGFEASPENTNINTTWNKFVGLFGWREDMSRKRKTCQAQVYSAILFCSVANGGSQVWLCGCSFHSFHWSKQRGKYQQLEIYRVWRIK